MALALALLAAVSAGCSKEEPTKDQLLSRADDYFAAGHYDKAEKDYREVLRFAPADPLAQRRLGIIFFDQGQMQAYPLLKASAELEPDNLEVQIRLSQMLLLLHEYTQAQALALGVLDKKPGYEPALMLVANATVAPAEIEETQRLIARLREQDEDRPGYHLALAELALRQEDQARAEQEVQAALNLDPRSSAAHAALGQLYWRRNNLQAAGEAFRIAADLAPSRSPIRLSYAEFKLRTGAVAEAKSVLEDISGKLPDYLPPRVVLMRIACAQQQDDCATRVQDILARDHLNYDGLFQDGVLNLAKGETAKAIREYEYLSNTYKLDAQARYQLALAYLLYSTSAGVAKNQMALERVETRLNEAIELEPRFEQAILLLAQVKISKGSPASAVELLKPLIKERPQTAEAHYLLASAYLAQQKKDESLAVYRNMAVLFPKDPQPTFLIGKMLEPGQRQAAREAFEKSMAISPNYLPAVEKLVDLHIADKQYATALERVQNQIDKDPKLSQPWALRGKIHLAQQNYTLAESDLLKSIDLDPKLEPAYLLLAQVYVASNRQDEAIEKLTAFVEKNQTVPALMQLGRIHERLEHFDAARDTYEKLLKVAPQSTPALNQLAILYSERLGKLDTGYDLAKKAREIAPHEPRTADTLGWISFKKGDYANALRLLQESVAKLPDSPEIQYHLGMAQYMLGEEELSRIALQKAVDASADFPGKDGARKRLSLLAINVGATAGVRTVLENYLREEPNDPAALVRLAQVQQRDGAAGQAVKTYEKVLADNPLYAPALRQLAVLYGQRSTTDDPKAYELATKARQAYPGDPEIAKALGILNYRRGNYPQSLELLKEAAAKRKDDPDVLYYLGEVYHQLKQYTECKDTLQRALTSNLSPELANDAKTALGDCTEMAPQ